MTAILFLLIIGAGIYFAAKWSMGELREQRLAQMTQGNIARERARLAENRRRYARRHGGPKIHKEALRTFLPYALLILTPILLTAYFTQDFLAVALMGVGMSIFGLGFFYYFNREARAKYNEGQDHEAYVEASMAGLDEFTIPEDWNRKYL